MQQPSQHWPGPPPTIPIVLSADERRALQHLCRAGTTQYRWPCVPGPFSWPPTAGRMMPSPDGRTVTIPGSASGDAALPRSGWPGFGTARRLPPRHHPEAKKSHRTHVNKSVIAF